MRGLRLVELACPRIVWVLGLFILGFPHFRVRGFIILIFLILVIILQWISITTSWRWSWPLSGGWRVVLILTLVVVPSYVRTVGSSPRDSLGRVSHKGRDQLSWDIHQPGYRDFWLQAKRHMSQPACK
jgi:hypothetical protein